MGMGMGMGIGIGNSVLTQPYRIVVALAIGLLATACGGGSGGNAPPADAAASPSPASQPASPAPASGPAGTGSDTGPDAAQPVAAASSSIIHEKLANGSRIWVVNPDNDSVSVIDASSLVLLAEIPVGGSPRTLARAADGMIWVANRASATVSVIDGSRLAVDRTIALPRASQPFGIVFSPTDGSPWVVLEALGQVSRLDPVSGSVTASVPVGANARHVSVAAGGNQLLVSRFISPPLPGESGASPSARNGEVEHGGEVVVVDTSALSVSRTVVLKVSDRVDSTLQARGIPNYLGAAAIAPDGLSAWIPSKQDNVMRGSLRDGLPLDFQSTVRAITSRIPLAGRLGEDDGLRVDHDNAGVASAAAFDPSGVFLFVALENSRQVAVLEAASGRELSAINLRPGPAGAGRSRTTAAGCSSTTSWIAVWLPST